MRCDGLLRAQTGPESAHDFECGLALDFEFAVVSHGAERLRPVRWRRCEFVWHFVGGAPFERAAECIGTACSIQGAGCGEEVEVYQIANAAVGIRAR